MERNGKPLGELPIMSIENPVSSIKNRESSYLRAYKALHLSRTLYKSALFMQNKANLLNAQMNVNLYVTKDYENKSNWTLGENKPNQTQFPKSTNECKLTYNKGLQKKRRFRSPKKQSQNKPNFRKAKMNLNFYLTKDYENEPRLPAPGKQTQSNPISLLPKSPILTTLPRRNPPLVSSYLNSPNLDNIWLLFLLIQVLYGLKYNYARKRQDISHLHQCRRAKRRRPLCRLDNCFTEKQLQY